MRVKIPYILLLFCNVLSCFSMEHYSKKKYHDYFPKKRSYKCTTIEHIECVRQQFSSFQRSEIQAIRKDIENFLHQRCCECEYIASKLNQSDSEWFDYDEKINQEEFFLFEILQKKKAISFGATFIELIRIQLGDSYNDCKRNGALQSRDWYHTKVCEIFRYAWAVYGLLYADELCSDKSEFYDQYEILKNQIYDKNFPEFELVSSDSDESLVNAEENLEAPKKINLFDSINYNYFCNKTMIN